MDKNNNNVALPSLKRLVITLILFQIVISVIFGGLNILATDILKIIPENSAFTTALNCASMILAGYIFGYQQEKKYPNNLQPKLKKLSLITTLVWMISTFLITTLVVSYQQGHMPPLGALALVLGMFAMFSLVFFAITYLSVRQGIKIRTKYLAQKAK